MSNAKKTKTMQTELEHGKQHANSNKKPYVITLGLVVGITGLWYLWGHYLVIELADHLRNKLPSAIPTVAMTLAELGQVGDLFGGINALFGALAFIGVGFAAYYQRQTFLQQREDSKENADALKLSNDTNKALLENAESSTKTNIALLRNAKQNLFHSLFFRMVEEVHTTIERIELTDESIYGAACEPSPTTDQKLDYIKSKLEQLFKDIKAANAAYGTDRGKYVLQQFHDTFYYENTKTLGPFFRNLYHTFSIINDPEMSYEEQSNYSKIARASINERILILVMLNGLTVQGRNLKELIERYGLLKHLSARQGGTDYAKQIAEIYYDHTAFKGFYRRSATYDPEFNINTMAKERKAEVERIRALRAKALGWE